MAKQIIVLNRQISETDQIIEVVFWFSITQGAEAVTSNSLWNGASSAENTAIQNGSVKEEAFTFTYPVSLAATNIKADLQQRWTNRNAEIGGIGPAVYYGIYLDNSTGWSA